MGVDTMISSLFISVENEPKGTRVDPYRSPRRQKGPQSPQIDPESLMPVSNSPVATPPRYSRDIFWSPRESTGFPNWLQEMPSPPKTPKFEGKTFLSIPARPSRMLPALPQKPPTKFRPRPTPQQSLSRSRNRRSQRGQHRPAPTKSQELRRRLMSPRKTPVSIDIEALVLQQRAYRKQSQRGVIPEIH